MVYFVIIFAFLIIFALLYLLIFVRPCTKAPPSNALLCDYAHRGLHGGNIPENSMAAFELAIQNGYGIELDVQLSRDGVVMVFHDYTLTRMTGCDQKLCELDCVDLQKLFLSDTNQIIPTFEQVLKLVNGRVPLLVELKGENLNTSLCKKAADLLSDYNGEYCIESFNPLLIRGIKKYLPNSFRGQLYTNVCRDKKKKSLLNIILTCMAFNFLATPNFIAYNQEDRNSLPVKITTKLYKAHKFVWTVKTDEQLSEAHKNNECAIFEKK